MLLSKVWGGDRLARFGKHVTPGDAVGESWELADLAETSTGGAGGGAFRSVITNGPMAGRTLHDAMVAWGERFAGKVSLSPSGGYPLLVKFLDAKENLSVQVHPSPAYAAAHPGAYIKSECWLILDAQPGAMIYKGLKPGVTREAFGRALTGDGAGVVDLIQAVPAVPGECHNLPSGTCHALGAGVLVLEVQTASDTTFRVYDWGRKGRALHVAEAMACIDFDSPPPAAVRMDRPGGTLNAPNFTLENRSIGGEGLDLSTHCGPVVCISGKGRLESKIGSGAVLPGTTMYVPRGVAGARLTAEGPLSCVFVTAVG